MATDFKLALRRLRLRPAFSLAILAILTLCIGANTTVFTLLSNAILSPLPVHQPDQLVSLDSVGRGDSSPVFSYLNYRDLRDRNTAFSQLAAFRVAPINLSTSGRADRLWGYLATGNYFPALGIQPLLGRFLTPDDDRNPGAHPVAVLSHATWTRRFAADPNVLNRPITLNGTKFTIVGVAPAGFYGTEKLIRCDIWVPMLMQRQIEPGNSWLDRRTAENIFLFGRLAPGVSVAQATANLRQLARQLGEEYPDANRGLAIALTPPGLVGGFLRTPAIGFSTALLAVTALVLLIACSNIAGLMLARGSDRARETAVCLALGAGASRLLRQHFIESFTLASLGGAAGLLLASWLNAALESALPAMDIPIQLHLAMDLRVIAFCALTTMATCLLCGLSPALQAARQNILDGLKSGGFGHSARRWQLRDVLVALQIAFTLVPLSAALLAVQGLRNAVNLSLGFEPAHAASLTFDLDLEGYSPEKGVAFQNRLLADLPHAALITSLPLAVESNFSTFLLEGESPLSNAERPSTLEFSITPGYLAAAGTRLLVGRNFAASDTATAPRVMLVNQTFARLYLPAADPFRRRVRFSSNGPWIQVVGIVEDGKYRSLSEAPAAATFVPFAQNYSGRAVLLARSPQSEAETLAGLRAAVRRLDPHLVLFDEASLSDHLRLALLPGRVAAGALSLFAVLSLLMAAAGIFGLMAYAVSQRSREIGIRMAIGASPWQAVGGLLRRATLLIASGAAVGLGLALLMARFLSPLLNGGESVQLPALVSATAALCVIALLAALYPARRATHIDPLTALRYD